LEADEGWRRVLVFPGETGAAEVFEEDAVELAGAWWASK
jgi:hypothetical protein